LGDLGEPIKSGQALCEGIEAARCHARMPQHPDLLRHRRRFQDDQSCRLRHQSAVQVGLG
jgi:hypothetical protein